jgi:ribosomal RNA-processing protein 9
MLQALTQSFTDGDVRSHSIIFYLPLYRLMKRRNESHKVAEDDSDMEYSDNSDDNELASLAGIRKKKKSKSVDVEEEKEIEETVDEKRIRLTRQYLNSVGVGLDDKDESEDEAVDDDEFGDDAIGKELRKQALRAAGKEVRRTIVNKMNLGFLGDGDSPAGDRPCISSDDVRIMRAHRLPTTCLALSEDDKFVMSASKDGSIYQFDIETGKKQCFNAGRQAKGHQGAILGLSLSSDSVYLASAGEDKTVRIWDVRAGTLAHTFRNHMDVVSDVAFRKDSLTLFSGSYDRTLKVFDVEQMNYLETLYGHQAPITAVDALYPERAPHLAHRHRDAAPAGGPQHTAVDRLDRGLLRRLLRHRLPGRRPQSVVLE